MTLTAKADAKTIVGKAVADFLRHLRERNASPHTIKAYSRDLSLFAAYAGSRGWKHIDHIAVRGFLSQLYEKGSSKTSVARALAAVRSLYRWLAREGVVEQNPAKLVATPRLPKKLPRVPTIEEMNSVIDGQMPEVAAFPDRDRLILELLYGCGIRNSELTGIDLDDIRLSAECSVWRFGENGTRGVSARAPEGSCGLQQALNRFADQLARGTAHDAQRGPYHQEDRCR
jgi:integrase/recombinase XerC